MGIVIVILAPRARLACAAALCCVLGGRASLAFPAADATSPTLFSDTPELTESDLRHQLQLQSGFGGAPAGGGWTFVPQLLLQEVYTDNVLNSETNRRWDLITIATPSFSLSGDVPNARVRLQYGPQFRLDARTPSQNSITNQLIGTGSFTIVPETFFVDARAFAGASPLNGGFGGGFGFSGMPTIGTPTAGTATTGLSSQNQLQTSSFSIAPYLVHRFGDVGTGKIGYQLAQSTFSQGNSYLPVFFVTGNNARTSLTNQGVVEFETGERYAPFRNLVSADARIGTGSGGNNNSQQYFLIDRLGYLVNRQITVFGEVGYENLRFNGIPPTRIDGPVWGVGTTLTPNPDSQITMTFGQKYGDLSFGFVGSYALTARTRISASYRTGLQTDLQSVQNQLDLTSLDSLGRTIDVTTGAPMFIGTGGLGVQAGLFRTKSAIISANTVLDRDQITVSVVFSQTTTIATAPPSDFIPFGIPAPPVGSTSRATSFNISWVHQINEALTMSAGGYYTTSHISSSGNQQSLVASVAMQYAISPTLAANARYSFLDRNSTTPGQTFYQNLFLVGLSKQF